MAEKINPFDYDRMIIDAIEKNKTASPELLHYILKVPKNRIHARLNALTEDGFLERACITQVVFYRLKNKK